jgi:hypothetical protein
MRLKLLLLTLSIIGNSFFNTVFAQKLDVLLTQYYSAPSPQYYFNGIKITSSSNQRYLISASSKDYEGNYIECAWLISISKNGDTNWTFRLRDTTPSFSMAKGFSAIECSDGNLLYLSREDSLAYLTKLTQNGDILWKRKLDTLINMYTDQLFETPDKGLFFGTWYSKGNKFIKTDSIGNIKAVRAIDGIGNSHYTCMSTCNDKGYILGCTTKNFSGDSVLILKVDSLGNTEWSSYVTSDRGAAGVRLAAARQLKNGYIAVATAWNFGGNNIATLIILNHSNNMRFEKELPYSTINDLIQENDSTIIVIGEISSSGMAYFSRIRIASLDIVDDLQFRSSSQMAPNSIIKAHDNGYVITGYTGSRCFFAQIMDNPPPKFNDNHPNREVKEDNEYRDTIKAADAFPNDKLRYYLSGNIPSDMRIDSLTGIIIWKPLTERDSGNHLITVRVKDRVNQEDTTSWNLHVTPVNDPHTITALQPLTVKEGDTVTFKVSVKDEENGPLKYRLDLDGHQFSDDSILTCYFNYSNARQYQLHCKVFDTIYSAETTVVITVNNTTLPPQILLPDSMQTSLSTMLRWGWLSGTKDPDLDSSSIHFRVYIYQVGRPSIRTIIDSLKSDSLCLANIDSVTKYSPGILSMSVEAFDLKGYSTGYGKRKNLLFSPPAGVYPVSALSFPTKYSAKYSTGKLIFDIPYGENTVPVNLILYDMRGCIIKKLNLQMSPGYNNIRLPIQEIPSGHYCLQVVSPKFRSLISCTLF